MLPTLKKRKPLCFILVFKVERQFGALKKTKKTKRGGN